MVRFPSLAFTSALVCAAFLVTPAAAFFFATNDHPLRAGPGGQTSVAGRVSEGQRLGVIKCRDEWCFVAVGKKTGWLEVRFIGVAADPKSAPPGRPMPALPPTWRPGPLDPADPPLGPPKGQLADPDLHLQ
jgi:hypothetical protein